MTVATALPTLLKLQRKRATIAMVLGCRGKPRFHKPAVEDVPDLDWSHCPLDLLNDPHIAAVLSLSRMADVSPLSGWPSRYAAWAVAGLMAVRSMDNG